jgi:hypothetical protein
VIVIKTFDPNDMTDEKFIAMSKRHVAKEMNIDEEYVFLVWFSKTLKNWKCICGLYDTDPDDIDYHLFECTYNGEKKQLYVDRYIKESNTAYDIK